MAAIDSMMDADGDTGSKFPIAETANVFVLKPRVCAPITGQSMPPQRLPTAGRKDRPGVVPDVRPPATDHVVCVDTPDGSGDLGRAVVVGVDRVVDPPGVDGAGVLRRAGSQALVRAPHSARE
jgi:hypothetical protein